MRMDDPYPTFTYLVTQIRQLYPRFAYLHVVEPRVAASMDREPLPGESNDFIRVIWTVPGNKENGSVLMSAGAYNRQLALEAAEERDELIAFGRPFIPNVSTSVICCMMIVRTHSFVICPFFCRILARSSSPYRQRHTFHIIQPCDILHQDI